jgi:hypothetical protein
VCRISLRTRVFDLKNVRFTFFPCAAAAAAARVITIISRGAYTRMDVSECGNHSELNYLPGPFCFF